MPYQHVKVLPFQRSCSGEAEKTPETAAPEESSASLVCVGTLSDDGLAVPSDGQRSGRLSNSEFLSSVDLHLSYLPEGQREDVLRLLQSYPTLFSDVPSRTNVLEHDIDVGTASPIKQHAYRCPVGKREKMKKEVDYLVENGLA